MARELKTKVEIKMERADVGIGPYGDGRTDCHGAKRLAMTGRGDGSTDSSASLRSAQNDNGGRGRGFFDSACGSAQNDGTLRTLTGKLKVLNRSGDYLFPVELWLLNDLRNRNDWRYEGVENSAAKFLGKPILTAYVGGKVGDGHNFQMQTDENGDPAPSFTGPTDERIVGSISEDQGDVRIEKTGGATWVVGVGTIFAWYAKELVRKLREYAEQGREIPVSIETLVSKSRMENGVEVEEEFEVLGVTILGDHVTPAVAGARIAALSQMESEFRELKVRAASYAKNKTLQKGSKNMSVYTKKQLETLQARVGSKWHVMAAAEDETGIHVALRNDNYDFARYDFVDGTDAFAESKLTSCAAAVDFGIGTPVDLAPVLDEITRLNAELTTARDEVAKKDSQIAAMNATENKRRQNEAKEIARRTLAAFNANREEKVADNCIESVLNEIECGSYTAMTDKDGLWCGGASVENAVYAICARKVQECDQANAEKNKTVFSFEKFRSDAASHDDGTVKGLLERLKA